MDNSMQNATFLLPTSLEHLRPVLERFMQSETSNDVTKAERGSEQQVLFVDPYKSFERFLAATSQKEKDREIASSMVHGGFENWHILKAFAAYVFDQGLYTEAVCAIVAARRLQYTAMRSDPSQENRILLAMSLQEEARILASQNSGLSSALNCYACYHAHNISDPNYSPFLDLAALQLGLPQDYSSLMDGRVNLKDLIGAATGIDIPVRLSTDEETVSIYTAQENVDLPQIKFFGQTLKQKPTNAIRWANRICKLQDARVYSDYFICVVEDREAIIIKDLSIGPAEFYGLSRKLDSPLPVEHLRGTTAFISARHGWMEYYHWLLGIVPRVGALLSIGYHIDNIIAFGANERKFCDEYLSLIGGDINICGKKEGMTFETDELIVTGPSSVPTRSELEYIRSIFLGDYRSKTQQRRIYISRQKATTRRLTNEDEVRRIALRRGFDIITLEDITVCEQARLFYEAEIVIAPHGAGLSNIVFCKKDTKVLELIAEGNPLCYHLLSIVCELDHSAIVCEWSGTDLAVDEFCFDETVGYLTRAN